MIQGSSVKPVWFLAARLVARAAGELRAEARARLSPMQRPGLVIPGHVSMCPVASMVPGTLEGCSQHLHPPAPPAYHKPD